MVYKYNQQLREGWFIADVFNNDQNSISKGYKLPLSIALKLLRAISHYIQGTPLSIQHRDLLSFVSCQSISRKRQFLNSCREIEKTMSSSSIRLARALALGWRENQNFYQYLRKTRLNDVSLSPGEGTEAFSKVFFFLLGFLQTVDY